MQRIITILAAVLTLVALDTLAGEANSNTICQLCGMDAAKSETKFVLQLKTKPAICACCLNCTRRLINKLGDEVTAVTALDYGTRKQVTAAEAFYVTGSRRIPKGSMPPFIFAFGSRHDAGTFKERYGGNTLTFTEILRQ